MNIFCKIGLHKADKDHYLRVEKQKGSHKWHRNYEVCKRCGKKLRLMVNMNDRRNF